MAEQEYNNLVNLFNTLNSSFILLKIFEGDNDDELIIYGLDKCLEQLRDEHKDPIKLSILDDSYTIFLKNYYEKYDIMYIKFIEIYSHSEEKIYYRITYSYDFLEEKKNEELIKLLDQYINTDDYILNFALECNIYKWLIHTFYKIYGKNISSDTMSDLLSLCI